VAIIETQPASYKGVEFLMISSRIAGGRKDVLFEFPNSDTQVVEDLGLRPRSYTMNVVIPHANYLETRDNLLRSLEDGIKGPLNHPFYGRVENVVARSYTINERITDLGRAELDIIFAVSDSVGIPLKVENAVSEAAALNDAVSDSVEIDYTDEYEVDIDEAGNWQDAKDLFNGAVDAFNTIQSAATALTDQVNQYAAQISAFSAGINQLISLPQDLASSISNIMNSTNNLFSSFGDTFSAFTDPALFDFGDNDIDISTTTSARIQRAKNRDVINQGIQSFALSYAYLNAVQIDFQTTVDIDAANVILENQYNKIMSTPGGVSNTTLTTLTDLRTISNQLLDDKRTEAKKIITVYTDKIPMSVLAYKYYGNTDLTDTLLELNQIKGASFVQGNIQILTS